MKRTILILILMAVSFGSAQDLKAQEIKITKDADGISWCLTDYTLPDFIINVRIYETDGSCLSGYEGEPEALYEKNYFSSKTRAGKYRIVVYIKPDDIRSQKILFEKEFEIK